MAWVENVRLEASNHHKQEIFTVKFRVYFSLSDRRLDIPYRVHSAIFEQSETLDQLVIQRNGTRRPTISHKNQQAAESLVAWFDSIMLKPKDIEDGQEITLSKHLDRNDQTRLDEKYTALVLVLSDVSDVMLYSDMGMFSVG
jgi:hypothetical protein